MNDYTYTIGPWQPFISGSGDYVVAAFDPPIEIGEGAVSPVAMVFDRDDDPDGNNINVITAAPRLLLAAQEAVNLLQVLGDLPMSILVATELLSVTHRLRLAIGAAHGEQP